MILKNLLLLAIAGSMLHVCAQSRNVRSGPVDAGSLRGKRITNPLNTLDRQALIWDSASQSFLPASVWLQNGSTNYCAPSGASTTAYTCNLLPAISAYSAGMLVTFKPDVNNTGASTLAINSLAAQNIQKLDSGSLVAVGAGDLDADAVYILRYNGTVFVVDPASGGGGGAPVDAQYVTLAVDGTLTQERVLTPGTCMTGTDAGAGSTYTYGVDTACAETRANAQQGGSVYSITAGTSTVYTAALTPTATAGLYTNGAQIRIKMDETSGSCPTLNVDAQGARKIYKRNGTTAAACIDTGELVADQVYVLTYNSSLDGGTGGWETDIGGGGGDPDTYFLNLASPTIYRDEFLGPFFTNNFGDLLWSFTYPSALPTFSRQVVSGRPGVIRITTAAGDNDGGAGVIAGTIHPDAFTSSTGWELNFVVRPQDSTSARYYVGVTNYSGGGGEPTVTEGIYIEYDTDQSDTEWMCVSDGPSGITRQTTGQAVVSATWYTLRIYSTTSGQILCSANGNTSSPVSTNLPTTTSGLKATVALNTRTTATRYLDIDIYTAKIVNSR